MPIIIQGNVIKEDGSAPPFGTVVERDCGDGLPKQVMVKNDGYFSFQAGYELRDGGMFADASQNFLRNNQIRYDGNTNDTVGFPGLDQSNVYPEDLIGCVLRAKFDGFRSTTVYLGTENRIGLMEVGTIVIFPVSRVTGTAVSFTNLKVPKEARKAFENGKKAFKKNEFDKAEKYFNSALEIHPEFSDAWIELGWLYQKQNRYKEARKAYEKASVSDKLYVRPYIHLAQLASLEKQWKRAVEYSEKALTLDPISFPLAYFYSSLAYYNMRQLDLAEKNIKQGIRVDLKKRVPKMYLVLANIRAQKRDPTGSMHAMQQYLALDPKAPDADHIRSLVKKIRKSIRAANDGVSSQN